MTHNLIKSSKSVSELDELSEAEIGLCIALGLSDKAIMKRVRVTQYQIYKISKRIGLKRKDYRDGVSPVSKFVMGKVSAHVRKTIRPRLLTD